MVTKKAFSICILAVAVSAARANATLVTFQGFGLHEDVTTKWFGQTVPTTAGQLKITYGGQNAIAYCVEFAHDIIGLPWQASIENDSVLQFGLPAGYLFDTFAGSVSSSVEAAGLQIALWEVLDDFDYGLDLSDGVFQLIGPNDVRTAAENYLAAIPGNIETYTPSSSILYSGDNPRSQHMIIPEPATATLIGLALVLTLMIRRRWLA